MKKPSPWGGGTPRDTKYTPRPHLGTYAGAVKRLRDQLIAVGEALQRESHRESRLNEVLDLFPNTMNRLQHIEDDIEDIAAGKEFRHKDAYYG